MAISRKIEGTRSTGGGGGSGPRGGGKTAAQQLKARKLKTATKIKTKKVSIWDTNPPLSAGKITTKKVRVHTKQNKMNDRTGTKANVSRKNKIANANRTQVIKKIARNKLYE